MSESESFLSRWLRLKRDSQAALPADGASPAAFDPASLPAIDSIVADTDIQPFLHEAVPAQLTRAALRGAWTADPAIRDFVGIAENQWNFNDHACMPGFGPLEAADYLATQALKDLTSVGQETLPGSDDVQQTAPPGSEAVEAIKPPAPRSTFEEGPLVAATVHVAGESEQETGNAVSVSRSHGGALPK